MAPLRIIARHAAFSYLGVARSAWVVCEGGQRGLKWLYAAAAAVDVAPSLELIPGPGAVGAALASLATQVSTTLALPFLIADLRPNARLMLEGILLRGVLPSRNGYRF